MNAPAFQFYAQDFLTGVMYLTNEEIGIYIKMLAKQWTDGKIPKKRLGLFVGIEWDNISDELKSKFTDHGEYVINERLEIERDKKSDFIEKQRVNGAKGGRPKKPKKNPKDNPNETQKNPLEDEIEIEEENEKENNKGGVGENFEPQRKPFLEGDPTHMGFKGKCRIWLEQEKNYIWGKVDDHPIQSLEYKIKEVHRRGAMRVDKEALFETFQVIIEKLPDWIRENKFSLDYIDKKFNEIIHAINNKPAGKKGSAPISEQDEARLREMLESGALLGVD